MKRLGIALVFVVGVGVMALGLCGTLVSLQPAARAEEEADPVTGAAQAWLALTDQGEYAQSWAEAASYFRTAAPQEQWVQSITAARSPLGAVVSRTLRSAESATSLPGAPDGEYVVMQYDTTFEHKQSAVETITPMRDTDGIWRVAGYYIK